MDNQQLNRFHNLLTERRNALLEVRDSGEQATGAVELDQTRVGRLSRMDALQAQAMAVETDRRRRLALRQIDAALQRMKTGEYGDCVRCAEPIAHARLAFDPAATLCIDCAGKAET
ncbi:MAG: TraR/DksA C4-type zinc finger protein [Gammaproteobacteria bacterium]|nr:TraR/DksA C4-type zinc finger protein [Gammaproteobacteria bacterium]